MPVDSLIGKAFNDFEVIERIGRGGMATVYRAHQASMHRDVALKILPLDEETSEDRSFQRRFMLEGELVSGLEHLHILPVYAYGIHDNVAFIAMRYLRGGSLEDMITQGTLSLDRGVDLFLQIGKALAYAHSKGVIHRDLKPSNILLDEQGNAYLTDFGLAKMIDSDQHMTKSGNIVGTPAYMSPEQLRGDPIDYRSDVYSLGIVLYQILTGRQPFSDTTSDVISVIYNNLEKAPIPPIELNPEVPQELQDIVIRAMAKSADDRYRSVSEMIVAVQHALGYSASTHDYPRPASVARNVPTVIRVRGMSLTQLLIVILIVLLLGVGLGTLLVSMSENAAFVAKPHTIDADGRAKLADIVPTGDEIEQAQRALGSDGFVAIMSCNQSSEYHSKQAREMTDFARNYGLRTEVFNPESDVYQQITLFENARTLGARGFIVCPIDYDALDETLLALDEAHIPLVLPDVPDPYGGAVMFTDNYEIGFVPGKYAGELIRDDLGGSARVVILELTENQMVTRRADGMLTGMLSVAPEVAIVARVRGATREWGRESVEQLLADGVEFDVILSINDAGTFGAIDALEAARIPYDDVLIASVDAEQLARQYIRDGKYLRGSLEIGRREFAQGAIDLMVKMLAGATVPQLVEIPAGQMITRQNVGETSLNPLGRVTGIVDRDGEF
jgi:serine/threonine protein kinase/DNA-binding LacI/PurR family transcriptional regulator